MVWGKDSNDRKSIEISISQESNILNSRPEILDAVKKVITRELFSDVEKPNNTTFVGENIDLNMPTLTNDVK